MCAVDPHNSEVLSESTVANDPVVRRPIACSHCGYNLEGLRAHGRCPECGTSVLESLASSIDLATSHMEPLERGGRLGGTLLVLAMCTLFATAATLGPVAYFITESITTLPPATSPSTLSGSLAVGSVLCLSLARIGACLGILASGPFPWGTRKLDQTLFTSMTRSRLFICGGFILWLVAMAPSLAMLSLPLATYAAIPATMVLIGLQPLVTRAGERSKMYRGSVARQPIQLLILAAVLAGGASLTKIFLQIGVPETEEWQYLLGVIALTSFALLELGLCYLVLNCWWIWRALASPPPQLDALLEAPKQ
ncbi:MAG: hypothetical protein EXS10_07045 [Phycisphaerales bacterium]|nr:hypothetical protein [Phycisphaerales bacterium]